MTTTIHLSPELLEFVEEKVQSGQFATVDEAANDLLQKQMKREKELAWLKATVQVGIDQADRGEFVDYTADDVIREGHARLTKK